jgi:hypothetical protein
MWIEANPVFGGSRSQVQFPADLSGYFRLPTNAPLHTHVKRGIICAALEYKPKKMDFHHNDVWRLNLPTRRQGLGGYRNTILVFERTDRKQAYRLWLIDRRSTSARLLRSTCQKKGRIGFRYRDDGTKRQYGFF